MASPPSATDKAETPAAAGPGLLDRTLGNLSQTWRGVAGAARLWLDSDLRPNLPDDDVGRLKRRIDLCLEGPGGDASARNRAIELGSAYLELDRDGRQRFLEILAQDYGIDGPALDMAVSRWRTAEAGDPARLAIDALRDALQPPRLRLLTQFNALPQGVKFLVDMRADLLELGGADPAMKELDGEFRRLLASWFDVGFLELRQITWDAPASLLEKLIRYEAVHAIESWNDLRNRLDSDRRCFAFFHPRMPDEPLIFVEVALVEGLASNVQTLLDQHAPAMDPARADTAIFYSISNAQKGLAGVSFGNFLIKRVVGRLAKEFPNLKTFATLSPIPGFGRWLGRHLADPEKHLLLAEEELVLRGLAGTRTGTEALKAILTRSDWPDEQRIAEAARPAILRLGAHYLMQVKEDGGRARDAVAHFHLSNGARMERLNWLGDRSPKGLKQSAGLMINYVYKLGDIEANHEAYTGEGRIVASSQVKACLKL